MRSRALFTSRFVAQTRNTWRVIREQSLFKVGFILAFATAFELGLWALFYDGFRFLEKFGAAGMITTRLFSLFFLGLGMMLAVSGLITAYAAMFRSEEIPYLLARPISVSRIVVYKFIESTMLSSWAFFFIVIPFVGAYASFQRLPLIFALWTLLFSVPFLLVCAGLGALVALCVVRWVPMRRVARAAVAAVVIALVVALFWLRRSGGQDAVQFALTTFVPGMVLAANPLIPSTWIAEGILSLSRGEWLRGTMMFLMLTSSALLAGMAVEWVGAATFFESWQRMETGVGRRFRRGRAFRFGDRLLSFLPADIRALVMKDVRTFFRDPMQWSQVLIFFGLLAMYFFNLRTLRYHTFGAVWQNMVCFINVFSVSAVMCSLGARFTYPQLSLEGHSFWILGLSPTSMRRILAAKFALAFTSLAVVSVALTLLSTYMLKTGPTVRWVSAGLVLSVALAVSGLSTGLGALFIDVKQRNPAAIVGGFGGTLNLVLGLAFMLAVILPFGAVFHLAASGNLWGRLMTMAVGACAGWTALVTLLAVLLPLGIGARALTRRDIV